jgi:PadR family transcriptional regulator, regulatory protein AphA
MASDELSLFSYEILGLVGRNGAGPHDLRRMVRQGRFFDWAGESQYYAEPKRLARLGYLDARKEPGQTTERTVYELTDKGLQALRAWARTPLRFTPLKHEALIRVMTTDLVGEGPVRASLAGLRDDIADLAARLDLAEAAAETLPHRRKYLLLNARFMRRLFALHLEWIDEIEAEYSPGTPPDRE